jgi:uncharacterized protein YjbJ (UPF0337 family)
MNKDTIEGKATRAVGAAKKKAGELLDDPALEAEGRDDEVAGRVQETAGDAKDVVDTVRRKVDKALDRS